MFLVPILKVRLFNLDCAGIMNHVGGWKDVSLSISYRRLCEYQVFGLFLVFIYYILST